MIAVVKSCCTTFRNTWCAAALMFCAFALVTSCQKKNPDFTDLTQLEGTWEMNFDGSAVYEKWEKVNDTLFTGSGYELSEGAIVPTESLQIYLSGDDIFYVPTVIDQNDGQPVKFKLTSREDGAFIFENPDHDFPTQIVYKFLPEDKLKASVSGVINGEMRSLEFDFTKQK